MPVSTRTRLLVGLAGTLIVLAFAALLNGAADLPTVGPDRAREIVENGGTLHSDATSRSITYSVKDTAGAQYRLVVPPGEDVRTVGEELRGIAHGGSAGWRGGSDPPGWLMLLLAVGFVWGVAFLVGRSGTGPLVGVGILLAAVVLMVGAGSGAFAFVILGALVLFVAPYDILTEPRRHGQSVGSVDILWALGCVVFFPWGAIAWFLFGRGTRRRELREAAERDRPRVLS